MDLRTSSISQSSALFGAWILPMIRTAGEVSLKILEFSPADKRMCYSSLCISEDGQLFVFLFFCFDIIITNRQAWPRRFPVRPYVSYNNGTVIYARLSLWPCCTIISLVLWNSLPCLKVPIFCNGVPCIPTIYHDFIFVDFKVAKFSIWGDFHQNRYFNAEYRPSQIL